MRSKWKLQGTTEGHYVFRHENCSAKDHWVVRSRGMFWSRPYPFYNRELECNVIINRT